MPDQYVYLLLAGSLGIFWLLIFFLRADLRIKLLKLSFVGGVAGLMSEWWYHQDYWRPPSILGNGVISLEDFLFGFFIVGLAATLYAFIFRKKIIAGHKAQKNTFLILFPLGILALIILTTLIRLNSVLVSSLIFIFFASFIIIKRPDLWRSSLISGLLLTALIVPIYLVLFDWLAPDFWTRYWLLAGTKYGVTILGNVPITELFWYFSWGIFGGIASNFYSGTKFVDITE